MLEIAVEVARHGLDETPPIPPPSELEPILRFSKLTGPALDAVCRALDDDEFRIRVLDRTPSGRLDAMGLLVLARPVGWEASVVDLARSGDSRAAADRDDAALRRVERRLVAAEDARARAESAATVAQVRADQARAELVREREAHGLTTEAERSGRSAAVDAQARFEAADRELTALRDDLEAAHRLATELRAAGAADGHLDPGEVDGVLRRALTEAEALSDALDEVRSAASGVTEVLRRGRADLAAQIEPVRPAPARSARPQPPGAARTRTPVAPPPGLAAGAPAAIVALLGTPRLVVLVDGYNVTIGRWGADLGITDQRARLERLAASAAARLGVDVRLVFDGADVAPSALPPRSLVRVLFSAPGEEADDVVIRLAGELPADCPVAVVSDDNRVRRGAAAAGANLVTVDAFLEAVRPPS